MVYSLDFKFVLGYNDRFSGCVDDSYRRYPVHCQLRGYMNRYLTSYTVYTH